MLILSGKPALSEKGPQCESMMWVYQNNKRVLSVMMYVDRLNVTLICYTCRFFSLLMTINNKRLHKRWWTNRAVPLGGYHEPNLQA